MRVQLCNKDVAGVMEGGRQLVVKSFKDFSMVSMPRVSPNSISVFLFGMWIIGMIWLRVDLWLLTSQLTASEELH